jgi:23S rRNA pseudouridine2605 synthase
MFSICSRLLITQTLLCATTTARALSSTAPQQLVRLDKLLAERSGHSRKDIDRLIRKGLVEIDGTVVAKSGAKLKVPWQSCPIVDGFEYPPPPLLVAYNKPLGTVSSMRDDMGRQDLSTVLPQSWQKSLHPVGRLDADTTGLLLFSRDGDLTHRLLHPKYVVEREYVAEVENEIDPADLGARLAAGIETIEDGEGLVVEAQLLEVEGQSVRLVVTEGKYRMVRRILANAGHPVVSLHRLRYGEVMLDELEVGEAVEVGGEELAWALGLKELGAPSRSVNSRAADREVGGAVAQPVGTRRGSDLAPVSGPVADPAAAMAEAWMPRRRDVQLVMDEAEVSREDAVAALKRHEGNLVDALEELM